MTVTVVNLAKDAVGMSSNAYLVLGETPVLVDTGANFDAVDAVKSHLDGSLDRIVLTHTHPDHVDNVEALKAAFDVPVYGYDVDHHLVDSELDHGETISLGDHEYESWYTPGHAEDHLCLYSEPASVLFSGDLIFPNGGVGRTDLPGCDHDDLLESIEYVLANTDPTLQALYSGHGPAVDRDAYRHIEAAANFAGL